MEKFLNCAIITFDEGKRVKFSCEPVAVRQLYILPLISCRKERNAIGIPREGAIKFAEAERPESKMRISEYGGCECRLDFTQIN